MAGRVRKERQVRRLGSNKEAPVDAKVVAATLCDLRAMIREHRFREDLYDRLSWCCLELPPLSDREGDARLIAEHFLAHDPLVARHRKKLTEDAEPVLASYPWPGNVREWNHRHARRALGRGAPASSL